MSGARSIAALAAVLAGACATEFDPPSLLSATAPRLLAIEVTPLEIGPGERVTLVPRLHRPGAAPTLRWSFCPLTTGPAGGYACVRAECQTALTGDADGRLDADPTALALACLERLQAGGAPVATATITGGPIDMVFTLEIDSGTDVRRAIARVPFHPSGAPEPRNQPPRIERVSIAGVAASTVTAAAPVASGDTVALVVETAASSLDAYVDALGRTAREEALVSFYATAGRFDADRAAGSPATGALELVELTPADQVALLYAVVRDGRGGQAVAGPFTVPIAR